MLVTAVILLAGNSTRFGGKESKQFFAINGKPLIYYTISSFEKSHSVDQIVLVAKKKDHKRLNDLIKDSSFNKVSKVVEGGETRKESVVNGLNATKTKFVLIHDGARPIVPSKVINKMVSLVKNSDAVIPVLKEENSIIKLNGDELSSYEDRNSFVQVQTPQAFKTDLIKKLHDSCNESNITDDAQLCLASGLRVASVIGDKKMMKVTTKDDAAIIEALLKEGQNE